MTIAELAKPLHADMLVLRHQEDVRLSQRRLREPLSHPVALRRDVGEGKVDPLILRRGPLLFPILTAPLLDLKQHCIDFIAVQITSPSACTIPHQLGW